MNITPTYHGSCFCGSVLFTVTQEPALAAYCHCQSCRHWSGGPISAFTLWQPDSVLVTQGQSNIRHYNRTPGSTRKWCKCCGGHLFTEHPDMGLIDVPVAVLKDFPFEPVLHVNYQESVLRVIDGLPKMKDLPQEAGGSGALLTE
ncbi:MAG: GFA family protein [Gammaproteobacteria bacterium]|nr:GFA family protein [Gammaproteobacteria bacterium]